MKVIVKSNEYIAISTKRKSECLFQLGQYLNKETCEIEMDKEQLRKITCTRKDEKGFHTHITLTMEDTSYSDNYIILDMQGNLVNVIDAKQFNDYYAILQEV